MKVLLLLQLCIFARSQLSSEDAVQCLPYYEWTSNTQGKTPCEVASSLLGLCVEAPAVSPLPEGKHYQGPSSVSKATPCICNTVVYSLLSACGLCQNRHIISWGDWSRNCPRVSLGNFPERLLLDLRIPGWAFQDVWNTGTFDQFFARDNANATEEITATTLDTPSESPTGLGEDKNTGQNPKSTPTVKNSGTDRAIPALDKGENEKTPISFADKVMGSVVGSIFGTLLSVIVIALIVRRRRRRS